MVEQQEPLDTTVQHFNQAEQDGFEEWAQWRVIDGIGPLMHGLDGRKRINWSKIIFSALDDALDQDESLWAKVVEEMRRFVVRVQGLGFNTITLDDVAHMTMHHRHGRKTVEKIYAWNRRFNTLIDVIKEAGVRVLVTTDVVPMTKRIAKQCGEERDSVEAWFVQLLESFFEQFPQVDGVVIRLGEGDGKDVKELFHSSLFLTSAGDANELIKKLLPMFEEAGKVLICRTWTVGAHAIGDLIWHRKTMSKLVDGIDSKAFVLSMKYGESDFFRYLPLNKAFFRLGVPKMIEFQARREYEGAGEYPSFVGFDVEHYASELREAKQMGGFSVWCQTGGWHAFRRRAFLDDESCWIEQNVSVIAAVMGKGWTVEDWVKVEYPEQAELALDFFKCSDSSIKQGLYIPEFARQKWFFRRTRIPPLLHAYWDCIFINHPVRKMMRHFIKDHEQVFADAKHAEECAERMIVLAQKLGWNAADVTFFRDTLKILTLAKRYYLEPFDEKIVEEIAEAKKAYKSQYPRSQRQRYRIKVDYGQMSFSLRKLRWMSWVLLRKKRGYRIADHIVTLHLLRVVYRFFKRRHEEKIPKFMRKSAMGVDVLFE